MKRRGTKIKLQCPESEWTCYEAPGPASIAGELWEAVQRVDGISRVQSLRGPAGHRDGQPDREPYLLTGFTQCAECGHSLTIKKHPRSGRPVYKCSWNNERGKHGCANGTSVPVQAAEEAVLNTLLCDVLEAAVIIRHLDEVRARAAATPEGAVEREHLSAEIERFDREIGNLVALAAQGSPAVLQGITAREAERQGQLDRLTPTVPDLDLAALDAVLREQFDGWHQSFVSRDAIPLARQILKQLLAGKLSFTIERGAASFTGEITLHPVLNLAVKRISSHVDPEPAERLRVKDLPLDRFLRDGPQGPEGQHRGIVLEGGEAPLRV